MTSIDLDTFESQRPVLFGLAYRMTGSAADADDVVQDTWLRARTAVDVEHPAAWLRTVATRLAIDRLRSAARRRELYTGPWLPEPILTDDDPALIVEADESLTLSFLHVLDRLEPVERAVFLLRAVFGVDYAEVAEVVDRSPETCRQIAHRARSRVRSERPRFDVDPKHRRALLESFLTAVLSGEATELEAMLADDVVLVADGGPSRHAARNPVVGPHRVSRYVTNLAKRMSPTDDLVVSQVNGAPAVILVGPEEVTMVVVPEFDGSLLRRIEFVSAPDKVAPVHAALRRRAAPPPAN